MTRVRFRPRLYGCMVALLLTSMAAAGTQSSLEGLQNALGDETTVVAYAEVSRDGTPTPWMLLHRGDALRAATWDGTKLTTGDPLVAVSETFPLKGWSAHLGGFVLHTGEDGPQVFGPLFGSEQRRFMVLPLSEDLLTATGEPTITEGRISPLFAKRGDPAAFVQVSRGGQMTMAKVDGSRERLDFPPGFTSFIGVSEDGAPGTSMLVGTSPAPKIAAFEAKTGKELAAIQGARPAPSAEKAHAAAASASSGAAGEGFSQMVQAVTFTTTPKRSCVGIGMVEGAPAGTFWLMEVQGNGAVSRKVQLPHIVTQVLPVPGKPDLRVFLSPSRGRALVYDVAAFEERGSLDVPNLAGATTIVEEGTATRVVAFGDTVKALALE